MLEACAVSEEAAGGLARLREIFSDMGSVLVAFSGGVDSSFALKVASTTPGVVCAALTATSPTYLESELSAARALAASLGVRHIVCDSNELLIENFSENDERRCYYCKRELFAICRREADAIGLRFVADGTNVDDAGDYRPGMEAARELGVRSPLREAGLGKALIRELSRSMGLSTWDKPQMACLSSRFPYGTRITEERVARVARAEAALRELGFRELRVRYHGDVARVEVGPDEVKALLDEGMRLKAATAIKSSGFVYAAVDLEGYRTGSMNEALVAGKKGPASG